MVDQSQMMEIALSAIKWGNSRQARIEAVKAYKQTEAASPFGTGSATNHREMVEFRRMESRCKRQLLKLCDKTSRKSKFEVIEM